MAKKEIFSGKLGFSGGKELTHYVFKVVSDSLDLEGLDAHVEAGGTYI